VHSILSQHQKELDSAANAWKQAKEKGWKFDELNYRKSDYLQMYAIYYFSVNVCKAQILLLELAMSGRIKDALHIMDIGVGTGSTAVALIDFLYWWGVACELHQETFPVHDFSLVGLDRSQEALDFSSLMVENFRKAIRHRLQFLDHFHPQSQFINKLSEWVNNISWQNLDITREQPVCDGRNLIILSNILNELRHHDSISHVNLFLNMLSPESLVMIIEPGTKKTTTELMKWRSELLFHNSDFRSISPCGQTIQPQTHSLCY